MFWKTAGVRFISDGDQMMENGLPNLEVTGEGQHCRDNYIGKSGGKDSRVRDCRVKS